MGYETKGQYNKALRDRNRKARKGFMTQSELISDENAKTAESIEEAQKARLNKNFPGITTRKDKVGAL